LINAGSRLYQAAVFTIFDFYIGNLLLIIGKLILLASAQYLGLYGEFLIGSIAEVYTNTQKTRLLPSSKENILELVKKNVEIFLIGLPTNFPQIISLNLNSIKIEKQLQWNSMNRVILLVASVVSLIYPILTLYRCVNCFVSD